MPLSTLPNAAIPAGLRSKTFDEVPADAKGHAAGVLFVAPDGDVLLCRRSSTEPNFGGHWALPGGKAEDGETPASAAARECVEECGGSLDAKSLKLLDRKVTPTGMVFHTFARPVDRKFQPRINDEHTGYAWFPLDALPTPIHPGVAGTLKDRLGLGEDMSPEQWAGLRDGFLQWTKEEVEGEHAGAADSVLKLAIDESMRSFDEDGRMRVKLTNISKEQIRPYLGREIPGWNEEEQMHLLGLDPDKTYQMYCPGKELEKAAHTFNGIQLLKEHKPVDADDHQKDDIVGTTGTQAVYVEPYLKNSLVFWAQEGIDLVENEEQRELSPGYHYDPIMEPGVFKGQKFHGWMSNIRGNHLTIVEEGRSGPDVMVADSLLEYQWSLLEQALLEGWAR